MFSFPEPPGHMVEEAPVADEVSLPNLQCTGVVPEGLRGRFLAVGSHPVAGRSQSGARTAVAATVHALALQPGQPASYRSRLVIPEPSSCTPPETRHIQPDLPPAATGSPTANIFLFGGRIYAYLAGHCVFVVEKDLSTARRVDLAGGARPVGGDPKVDPSTGELHVVSWAPEAAHHVLGPNLHHRTTRPIAGAPGAVLDVLLTRGVIVLLTGTSAGITGRAGDARPRWIDAEVAGAVNANDDGDAVEVLATHTSLVRWRLGRERRAQVETVDHTPQRCGRINTRVLGDRPRYLWSTAVDGGTEIYRHDLRSGARATCELGPGWRPGAITYVADPSRSDREDGGWLVGLAHDAHHEATELVVLDAAAIDHGPVLVVRIPRRLGGRLRSTWEPAT